MRQAEEEVRRAEKEQESTARELELARQGWRELEESVGRVQEALATSQAEVSALEAANAAREDDAMKVVERAGIDKEVGAREKQVWTARVDALEKELFESSR